MESQCSGGRRWFCRRVVSRACIAVDAMDRCLNPQTTSPRVLPVDQVFVIAADGRLGQEQRADVVVSLVVVEEKETNLALLARYEAQALRQAL